MSWFSLYPYYPTRQENPVLEDIVSTGEITHYANWRHINYPSHLFLMTSWTFPDRENKEQEYFMWLHFYILNIWKIYASNSHSPLIFLPSRCQIVSSGQMRVAVKWAQLPSPLSLVSEKWRAWVSGLTHDNGLTGPASGSWLYPQAHNLPTNKNEWAADNDGGV